MQLHYIHTMCRTGHTHSYACGLHKVDVAHLRNVSSLVISKVTQYIFYQILNVYIIFLYSKISFKQEIPIKQAYPEFPKMVSGLKCTCGKKASAAFNTSIWSHRTHEVII